MSVPRIKLYQFPISHFSEKARWALDLTGLDYKCVNLLPGLHAKTCERLAGGRQVPVMDFDGDVVQGSAQIVDYLAKQGHLALTEAEPNLLAEQKEVESYIDKHIGPHVRRAVYYHILGRPEIVKPFFTHKGPWYGGLYIHVTYPKLVQIMRKLMKINAEEYEKSIEILKEAFAKLNARLEGGSKYLVGDSFSRADLAFAALSAPFFMPPAYGLDWPEKIPEPLEGLIQRFDQELAHGKFCYAQHRTL